MRRIRRQALQCRHDQRLDPGVVDRPGCPGARLVVQAIKSVLDEPAAPFADRRLTQIERSSDFFVLRPVGAGQDDPSTKRQRLRRHPPRRKQSQFHPFRLAQIQLAARNTQFRLLKLQAESLTDSRDLVIWRTADSGH